MVQIARDIEAGPDGIVVILSVAETLTMVELLKAANYFLYPEQTPKQESFVSEIIHELNEKGLGV